MTQRRLENDNIYYSIIYGVYDKYKHFSIEVPHKDLHSNDQISYLYIKKTIQNDLKRGMPDTVKSEGTRYILL